MPNQIAYGSVEIRLDGQLLEIKKGAIARGIVDVERTAVMGEEYNGFKEEAVAAECEFSITAKDNVSITDIANATDATLIFESRGTLKSFVMRNAVCKGNVELTGGEGESKLLFFGPRWEENN